MSKKGKRVIPKFQKQISQELTGPAFDKERGNPNDAVPNKVNRGNQLSYKGDTVKPFSIGIQDIDESNRKLVRRFTGRVTKKLSVETFMDYPIPDFIIK